MIEIKQLSKNYKNFLAVDHLDMTIYNGEITILLGPNGAGKSTTIKSIAGLLSHEGEIYINGNLNTSIEAKKQFGYISEVPTFYETLTVEEHIHFIGKAYKVKNYMEIAENLLEQFHMTEKRKAVAKELSKGMTQKLSMLLALLHKPDFLLVDEPMIGLDPSAIEEVLKMFLNLKEQSKSILISTHIIDVINDIWDIAYIMNKGKIVHQVKRNELQGKNLKDIFFKYTEETA